MPRLTWLFAKTQISPDIRPVWSESSLSAWRKLGALATHLADAKANLNLRWAHNQIVGFVMRRLKCEPLKRGHTSRQPASTTTSSLFLKCQHLAGQNKTNTKMSRDMTKPTMWLCAKRRLRPALASASSLSACRKLGSLATHWMHSEDSDLTGRMPRLIWVFSGRTLILLVLLCRGSNVLTKPWNTRKGADVCHRKIHTKIEQHQNYRLRPVSNNYTWI